MKKSYNPFTMWGSAIGAFMFGFVIHLVTPIPLWHNFSINNLLWNSLNIIWMFLGFLLGWGVNSLFRRLQK